MLTGTLGVNNNLMSFERDCCAIGPDTPPIPVNVLPEGEVFLTAGCFDIRGCADGIRHGIYRLNLNDFARASSLENLANNISNNLSAMETRHTKATAMALAMDTPLPTNGLTNRVGFNVATYRGESAFSLSYARVQKNVDFSLGYARSGNEDAGRMGVGFSW